MTGRPAAAGRAASNTSRPEMGPCREVPTAQVGSLCSIAASIAPKVCIRLPDVCFEAKKPRSDCSGSATDSGSENRWGDCQVHSAGVQGEHLGLLYGAFLDVVSHGPLGSPLLACRL